jgi:hypothetical protein
MTFGNSLYYAFTIFLLLIVIFLVINKKQYYLLSLVLTRILPYYFILCIATYSVQTALILILYFTYKYINYIYNKDIIPNLDNKHIQTYLNDFLIDAKKHIDISVINKPEINPNKNYIFLYSPHAIYNQGFIYLFGLNDTHAFINKEHHRRIIPLVDPMFNLVPLISELFSHFGFMDISRKTIDKLLDEGNSIALSAGGIQELFKTEENVESVYIKNRNTIFEIARQKNVEIIPVFASGESDWYIPFFKCDCMPSKYISIGTYAFSWGKLFQPWLPKKNKLTIAFGNPISIDYAHNQNNTSKIIKQQYIKQVKELHHKVDNFNDENRLLKLY